MLTNNKDPHQQYIQVKKDIQELKKGLEELKRDQLINNLHNRIAMVHTLRESDSDAMYYHAKMLLKIADNISDQVSAGAIYKQAKELLSNVDGKKAELPYYYQGVVLYKLEQYVDSFEYFERVPSEHKKYRKSEKYKTDILNIIRHSNTPNAEPVYNNSHQQNISHYEQEREKYAKSIIQQAKKILNQIIDCKNYKDHLNLLDAASQHIDIDVIVYEYLVFLYKDDDDTEMSTKEESETKDDDDTKEESQIRHVVYLDDDDTEIPKIPILPENYHLSDHAQKLLYNIAKKFYDTCEYTRAIVLFKRLLSISKVHSDIYNDSMQHLYKSYSQCKKYNLALLYALEFAHSTKINSDIPGIYYKKAEQDHANGQYSSVIWSLEHIFPNLQSSLKEGEDCNAIYMLGHAYYKLGKYSLATNYLKKIPQDNHQYLNTQYLLQHKIYACRFYEKYDNILKQYAYDRISIEINSQNNVSPLLLLSRKPVKKEGNHTIAISIMLCLIKHATIVFTNKMESCDAVLYNYCDLCKQLLVTLVSQQDLNQDDLKYYHYLRDEVVSKELSSNQIGTLGDKVSYILKSKIIPFIVYIWNNRATSVYKAQKDNDALQYEQAVISNVLNLIRLTNEY